MARNDKDERGSRRPRDDDSRDREERPSRRGRDDDERPQRRASRDEEEGSRRGRSDSDSRERASSRDRDDERPSRRGRDDEDDRGSRRGSGSSSRYEYHRRSDEEVRTRAATSGDKFDKYFNPNIKSFTPRKGINIVRILPPTWKAPQHYGYDLWMHYGVGSDQQTYLDLKRMADDADDYFKRAGIKDAQGGPDPIEEEIVKLKRDGEDQLAKDAASRMRVGVYVIDRDDEKVGPQFWAMPQSLDKDLVKQSINKKTLKALAIDDPEEGYDISFEKIGEKKNTKYEGLSIDRDPTPLGKAAWLDFAMDNPIPEQLIFYPYEHIAAQLGGGGDYRSRRDRDDDGDRRPQSRDRESSRGRDSERDERPQRRNRDEDEAPRRSSRDRDDERPSRRGRDEPSLDWASIHEMTRRELEDLVDEHRLDVQPKEAKSDEDLADWICEEMKVDKEERPQRRSNSDKDEDSGSRLRRMREERD